MWWSEEGRKGAKCVDLWDDCSLKNNKKLQWRALLGGWKPKKFTFMSPSIRRIVMSSLAGSCVSKSKGCVGEQVFSVNETGLFYKDVSKWNHITQMASRLKIFWPEACRKRTLRCSPVVTKAAFAGTLRSLASHCEWWESTLSRTQPDIKNKKTNKKSTFSLKKKTWEVFYKFNI